MQAFYGLGIFEVHNALLHANFTLEDWRNLEQKTFILTIILLHASFDSATIEFDSATFTLLRCLNTVFNYDVEEL